MTKPGLLVALALGLFGASAGPSPGQQAVQPAQRVSLDERTNGLVNQLVLDRAAVLAALERRSDEREGALLIRLGARDRSIRASLRAAVADQAQTQALQLQLASVSSERQNAADKLAVLDVQFGADLDAYRKQVSSIASSPDPRKREALQRYADGDRTGALAVLVQMQEAETRAVAAGWREIGALATDMRDRGERTTADVIAIYEQVVRLDPDQNDDWVSLGRLYQDAGRLDDALNAAQRAAKTATSDHARSVAASDLGDVLQAQGNLLAAAAAFEQSMEIARRLAAAAPADRREQYNLAIGYERLADVLTLRGDQAGALADYRQEQRIINALAASDPTDKKAQRAIGVSFEKIGWVLSAQGDMKGALSNFQSATTHYQKMLADDPNSAQSLRDLDIALYSLGSAQKSAGDPKAARALYEDSLAIRRRLAAADPAYLRLRADVAFLLIQRGNLESRETPSAANVSYGEALKIYRDLPPALFAEDFGLALRAAADGLINYDRPQSRVLMAESLRMARAGVARDPVNMIRKRDLIITLRQSGDLQRLSGDTPAAEASYQEMRTIARALVQADPTNYNFISELANSYDRLGYARLAAGDVAGAKKLYADAVTTAHAAETPAARSLRAQRMLIYGYENLEYVQWERKAYAEALITMRAAAALTKDVLKANPSDLTSQVDAARMLTKLGAAQGENGDKAGSLASISESAQMRLRLADEHPENLPLQVDAGGALFALSSTQSQAGDLPNARLSIEKSIQVRKRTLAAHPGEEMLRDQLGQSFWVLSYTLKAQKDFAGALKAIDDGVESYAQGLQLDPQSVMLQQGLAYTLYNAGGAAIDAGDRNGAAARYLRAIAHYQMLDRKTDIGGFRDVVWQMMSWIATNAPQKGATWRDVAAYLDGLKALGLLTPAGATMRETAQAQILAGK